MSELSDYDRLLLGLMALQNPHTGGDPRAQQEFEQHRDQLFSVVEAAKLSRDVDRTHEYNELASRWADACFDKDEAQLAQCEAEMSKFVTQYPAYKKGWENLVSQTKSRNQ